ncbi:aldehyde dehydrogenase family protein [Solimonas sp. K1W22B-7]|uniref:aldehyde dehydrogenase family protein n=1 Tax=Solimonas sp. K1W22B-7 TaxID=2303331 RepID=UPI000E3329BC|nr:aldehyde dehydrogenase family protein [Solimonas sp. K1W22B-7]AXQ28149.1 aldehyde dehydrogenase family protein [Solimonas sp. K1W22B-7]
MGSSENTAGIGEPRLLIDGKLVEAKSGKRYANINPATGEVIGHVADAGLDDAEAAIAAARRAFDTSDWSTNRALRKRCLTQLRDGLRAEAETLRAQAVAEVGAPMAITANGPQGDGPIGILDYVIELLDRYDWEQELPVTNTMGVPSKRLVWKEAGGVVAAISPWNFPFQINMAKVAPALAAGCTVVLKSAPDTPWTATIIGKVVAEKTDIPPGVFNVLTSSDPAAIGEKLVADPRIDIVSFTGSTQTGRRIMASAAGTLKRVFLELGGKSANIILDDADFSTALLSGLAVCYHAGQGCAITTRILLPESRYEEGVQTLKAMFGYVQPGDQFREQQIMGPLISAKQQQRVLDYIETGKREGARLVCGGGKPAGLDQGYFVEPTLFADVTNDMRIAQEEIFGPVLVAISYKDDEDAARIANDSIYGLSGSIYSADPQRALRLARKIRTGTLNVNGANFFAPDSPFGGYKQSGIGREMGVQGFEEYLETKTVAIPA